MSLMEQGQIGRRVNKPSTKHTQKLFAVQAGIVDLSFRDYLAHVCAGFCSETQSGDAKQLIPTPTDIRSGRVRFVQRSDGGGIAYLRPVVVHIAEIVDTGLGMREVADQLLENPCLLRVITANKADVARSSASWSPLMPDTGINRACSMFSGTLIVRTSNVLSDAPIRASSSDRQTVVVHAEKLPLRLRGPRSTVLRGFCAVDPVCEPFNGCGQPDTIQPNRPTVGAADGYLLSSTSNGILSNAKTSIGQSTTASQRVKTSAR